MFYIESERLRLIPLNSYHLNIYHQQDLLADVLGLQAIGISMEPFFQSEFDDALENHWKPMVEKNPEQYQWFTNWLIVLKQENTGVGGIGLTGLPDENGEAEVGYGIGQDFRGRGLATEALNCLCQGAFQNPGLSTIIAHTPVELLNSQRVLQRAGFEWVRAENELIKWALKRNA